MKPTNLFMFIAFLSVLFSCAEIKQKGNDGEGLTIDFQDPQSVKSSDVMADRSFIKLETSAESLIGKINQIEIVGDRIYILDEEKTNSIFVFSMQGKLLQKLSAEGNGPGEFAMPYSFKVDPQGYIYVLDRTLSRLLKYRLTDLSFVEEIALPYLSPLSFFVDAANDLFIYYYPIRKNSELGQKQIVVADKSGKIIRTLYDGPASGKVLHGSPDNIYAYNKEIRIYPYFGNQIYKIENGSLAHCYQLHWGKYTLPEERLFDKPDDRDVMKELISGEKDWIRLLFVYETDELLVVKYYIKLDFYLSYWDKQTHRVVNTKAKDIVDDLGLGGTFPLPMETYQGKMVGIINPFDVAEEQVNDEELSALLQGTTEDSNPILVLYRLK